MIVSELIEILKKLPPNLPVLTNQCQATSAHEDIDELDTVELVSEQATEFGQPITKYHVFVGTSPAR